MTNSPLDVYLFCQSHDDVSEVGQGAVDALGLREPDALGSGVLQPLGSSQIHEIQHSGARLARQLVRSADPKLENAVAPG